MTSPTTMDVAVSVPSSSSGDLQQPIEATTPMDRPAAALSSPQATALTTSMNGSPAASPLPADHDADAAYRGLVGGTHLAADQPSRDAYDGSVGGYPLPADHVADDAHATSVGGVDLALALAAATLDDIERTRIAAQNRVRAAEADGLPCEQHLLMVDLLTTVEHQATLDLRRALRAHPLGSWVKATTGVGDKQGARLIAAIGDPYWNHAENRPRRGPAELWAYCGFRPGQRRQRGVQSNWNAEAKMRARLVAEAAIKAGIRKLDTCDDTDGYDVAGRVARTPLGEVYLRSRETDQDLDASDLHKHNRALRKVAKEVLKDLWRSARDAHESAA